MRLNRDQWVAEFVMALRDKPQALALDKLFRETESLLLAEKFDWVDRLLNEIVHEQLELPRVLAVLTATLQWKHSLPNRAQLFEDARQRALALLGEQESRRALFGLE